MNNKRNITSPLRSGFDYQDLWTLKLCGEWLLNPQKYKWIQIEANPTEKNFFLDDIVLLDKSNQYHFFQVKFKSDNNYQWTWDGLLKSRKSKRDNSPLPSLLKKWVDSVKNVGSKNVKSASLVTNGDFSEEIKKYLSGNLINIEELKKDTALYKKIKDEFENEKQLTDFFSTFKFIYENRSIDEIEKEIVEDIFYGELRATQSGVNNLLLAIKKEARKSSTIQLKIEQIKKWCEFDNPQPLNESFEIPDDFQFFDEAIHRSILEDLKKPNGGIKIIHGKPGTGKSVYLSQLSKILEEQKIVTIKHHYHINPSENNIFERLNATRVIEAIKAQFKNSNYRQYIGDLENKNSKEISLKDFISKVAQNLSKAGKSFVLIIDGLDHVVREKDVSELKAFLDEIFYPQEGVWIILGTQPQVINESLLHSIFSKCPQEDKIEIRGLNKKAVFEIINKNQIKLTLPDDKRQLKELSEKIFSITKGNPLYLRYVLQQLKNTNKKTIVTEYSCRNLIQYDENIENYYSQLWGTLDNNTKSLLLTFVSIDFQFTKKQFIECISTFIDPQKINISESFNKIKHLITLDSRGKLRIYHDSFRVFLINQKEWVEQKQIIKRNIKGWLESSGYENLKWAELRKLEYSLGNNKPILEINRSWLIDAITHPRNYSQIKSQLELASKVAILDKDYAKALQISHLTTYYENAQDFVEEALKLIWINAIKLNPKFIDDIILSELPSDVLEIIADIAEKRGKTHIIYEIIEILQDRLSYQEYRKNEIPNSTRAIIKIVPYDRTHEVKRVFNYIIQFRDLNISPFLFDVYSKQLLLLSQIIKLNELLTLDLEDEEKKAILKNCIVFDYENRKSDFKDLIKQCKRYSLEEQIYLILQGEKAQSLPRLPDIKSFPETIKEYGGERNLWSEKFYSFFNVGLIYVLSGKGDNLEKWIEQAYKNTQWSIQATIKIFRVTQKIAKTIQTEKKIDYKDIFSEFSSLENLLWPDDRDRLEFKHALTDALTKIFKDIVTFKKFLGDSIKISKTDYEVIISTPFYNQYNLFNLVLDLNKPILEKEVFKIISDTKEKELSENINYFPERSEDYAKLSKFNTLYNETKKAKELLVNAADNFLGYGYHKDIYLFDVLETIEFCAKANVDNGIIDNLVQRIIPIIFHVEEYTNGDETNHLPVYLADFLSKYNKELLFKFYFSQAEKEELYPAQETFKYVVKSLSFKKESEIALATTALDKDSLNTLKEKAKSLKGAKQALNIIKNNFGDINYPEENYSSSYNFKDKKVDYSKVLPNKLEKHLEKMKNKWDLEKYLIGWTKFWLEKKNKQKVYNLIKKVALKDTSIKSVSGELLDVLYPLAYEFENDKAFEYLCFAQMNDYGWNRYWTDKKKAENRWKFLKEKYPQRYLEFFAKSTEKGFPLSRGVEFFLYFDDIERAKEITESGVSFSESLMANLKLDKPDWAQDDFSQIDEIDLLFQRLVWPSPLVRERAATAIGNLIAFSSQNKEIYLRFLKWIQEWKIESIIAIGLLPIIKAFQVSSDYNNLAFINIENIVSVINANSIVIEKLLVEIAKYTKQEIKKFPEYLSIRNYSKSYIPNDFFKKYIKTILAPIYLDRANEIEKRTGIPFIKLWAYNAEAIAKDENIKLIPNHYFYGHSKNDKFLIGFSTKVSEIYRSAFLRVLYSVKKVIPDDFYLEYSFATLPVDLSFWKISSNRMPKYWPKLAKTKTEQKDLSLIQFKTPVSTLLKYKENNFSILGASGAICPETGWYESPSHSFSLIGFGYKVIGKNLPTAEEVSREILWSPQTLIIPTKADRPLNFLENYPLFDVHTEPIQIKDLVVFPLVTRNKDLTIGLWQYYRDKNQSFNIVDELRNSLKIEIKQNRWAYIDKEDNEIIVFEDWLDGLQERYEFEMPIPHGQQILINNEFLNSLLENNNLRLGFLLKTTFRNKKYSYDEIEVINDYDLLGISNIIT